MTRRRHHHAEDREPPAPRTPRTTPTVSEPGAKTGPVEQVARMQRTAGNSATAAALQRAAISEPQRLAVQREDTTTTTTAPSTTTPAPSTTPAFTLTSHAQKHIFEGEYGGGKLKGYHSRPGGTDHGNNSLVAGTKADVGQDCYTARWQRTENPGKTKFSTFFPDSWSRADVTAAIGEAVADALKSGTGAAGGYFAGSCAKGLGVQGYLDGSKQPVTAFPKV